MVGFDDIDKRHRPKSSWIQLECENCEQAGDGVAVMCPIWYNGGRHIALCRDCAPLNRPTAPPLVAERNTAILGLEDFLHNPK